MASDQLLAVATATLSTPYALADGGIPVWLVLVVFMCAVGIVASNSILLFFDPNHFWIMTTHMNMDPTWITLYPYPCICWAASIVKHWAFGDWGALLGFWLVIWHLALVWQLLILM